MAKSLAGRITATHWLEKYLTRGSGGNLVCATALAYEYSCHESNGVIDLNHTSQLPPSNASLDIAAFSRLFRNVTNSYKYVFFLSILEMLRQTGFASARWFRIDDLVQNMLAHAWYPHTYFKLSFGAQDRIGRVLNELSLDPRTPRYEEVLRELTGRTGSHNLHLFVPYRLLRVFFEADLSGLSQGKLHDRTVELSIELFDERRPLYRFDQNRQSILVHPDWCNYLKDNYLIVKSWASWQWLDYMQRKNPSTPGLSLKLFPPDNRETIPKLSRDYWSVALANMPHFRCIYSGLCVRDSLHLDHFVPWTFVAHNQLWNLVPTVSEVNSRKSNHLPCTDYLVPFVRVQHEALHTVFKVKGRNWWSKIIEPFLADLKLDEGDLLDFDKLGSAYESTIKPMLVIAGRQGFLEGWTYSSSENASG